MNSVSTSCLLGLLLLILLSGCSSPATISHLPNSLLTETTKPVSLSSPDSTLDIVSTVPIATSEIIETDFATITSHQVIGSTPISSLSAYQGEMSTYRNLELGISFEYPRLYDTVVIDQIYDKELDCTPKYNNSPDVGQYIIVSDWIEIEIYPINQVSNPTATPFSGDGFYGWTELVRAPMKVGGIGTIAIKGKDVAMTSEEGDPMLYHYYWVTVIDREGLRVRFFYSNTLFGTPPCMYNYRTSDEEIYLKILETFEFVQ